MNEIKSALLGGFLTATSIFLYFEYDKRSKLKALKQKLKDEAISVFDQSGHGSSLRSGSITTTVVTPYDETLIREQLARNYAFLGEEGVNCVRKSFVVVVGLGGVGSHAHLRLIDFDQVTLSSLNRHAVARLSDVGTSKAACLEKHFKQIFPHATIEIVVDLFNKENADKLLIGNPDFVLDCIDNVKTKIELIHCCVDKKLQIISSMGSGAKSDPSRIQIADISDTFEDPLARTTRRGLRSVGIDRGVTVVYSTEKPGKVGLLPLEQDKVNHADEYSALPDFRVRILPVLGTLPAMFGCAMATYVITKLADWPVEPLAIKMRDNTYVRLHRDLLNREKDTFGCFEATKLSVADIAFIFEEVWRGKSALSGEFDKTTLLRWDISKPATFGNIICLTRTEAAQHVRMASEKKETGYSHQFLDYVKRRFEVEKQWMQYRNPSQIEQGKR